MAGQFLLLYYSCSLHINTNQINPAILDSILPKSYNRNSSTKNPFRSGLRIDVKVWCSSLQRCRQLLRCLKLLPHLVTKKFLSTYPWKITLVTSNYMVSTIPITWSLNLSLKQLWATGSLFASRHEGEPRDQHWTTMIFSATNTKWGVWKKMSFLNYGYRIYLLTKPWIDSDLRFCLLFTQTRSAISDHLLKTRNIHAACFLTLPCC